MLIFDFSRCRADKGVKYPLSQRFALSIAKSLRDRMRGNMRVAAAQPAQVTCKSLKMETPDELTMAERGDRDAQFNLALRYQDGTGFPRDYQQARRWYIEAAKQGHTTAQYSLGLLLAKGLGRPKDVEAAAAWYRKAAEGGHQAAQFNLAQMYEQGEGVPRDLMMAYVWFALAGASSAPSGAPGKRGRFTLQLFPASKSRTVAEMHRNRLGLLMSESERGKATQVAEEYFAKHVQPFR